MSVINANPLLAAAGGDYQISRSVRLRRSAGGYFNRTPASAGNQKTWTWSAWVKRGQLYAAGSYQYLLGSYSGSSANETALNFGSSDQLTFFSYVSGYTINCSTSSVFRDLSAWYHVVLAVDTTQATNSNGVKLYINGVQQTLTFSAYTQNHNTWVNGANVQLLSNNANLNSQLDGYMTEIVMVDGQALTPSSFGENDSITGVWKPKKYAGTYGTNGYYVNFSDNSAATAAAIGKDYSGNGNNWTPNNISVTAGATYDSMLDTPTPYADGGNGRGNYATLNAVLNGQTGTLSAGNLQLAGTGASAARSTIAIPSSGLFYVEATAGASSASGLGMAFGLYAQSVATGSSYITGVANSWGIYSDATGVIGRNGTNTTGITNITSGVTYQLAVDLANSRAWLGVNNVWFNGTSGTTGDPSTGANPTFTSLPADLLVGLWADNTKSWTINFGQRPFAYTPPTGFKALNTQNLPDSTIKKGNAYFDAKLYTGNGSTQTISGLPLTPDFVWIKRRSGTVQSNQLYDTTRGVQKVLYSDLTNAETTDVNGITAFTSDGFSVGSSGGLNNNGDTHVAWTWRKGASAGFDIVTYTGTGANTTVNHSLGVAPKMVIVKSRNYASGNWVVWHTGMPQPNAMWMNTTNGLVSYPTAFNSTSPTSTNFSVGTAAETNGSGNTFVAYLFAEVAGFSKFGSYTGNGSADGPFVYLGFRPKFVMIKKTSAAGDSWYLKDTSRSPYNVGLETLLADTSGAEGAGESWDALSNGVKIRSTASGVNTSGATYIFAAFAESPFKNSLAR